MRRLAALAVVVALALPLVLRADPPKIELVGSEPTLVFKTKAEQDVELKALHTQFERYQTAFKEGNPEDVAKLFTKQGCCLSPDGRLLSGREAITASGKALLAKGEAGFKTALKTEVAQVRFLSPTVALEFGSTEITVLVKGKKTTLAGTYSAVWTKEGDEWLIEASTPNLTPRE